MVKAKDTTETVKPTSCFQCKYYDYDVQKTSLPVMRNKVFHKITMRCHHNEKHTILNEKYESSSPSKKIIEKIAPMSCKNYDQEENDTIK